MIGARIPPNGITSDGDGMWDIDIEWLVPPKTVGDEGVEGVDYGIQFE